MTRTVAIGAVLGFAITVLVLALWERSESTSTSAADAGAPLVFMPILEGRTTGAPLDRRVQRVLAVPTLGNEMPPPDAGVP
jgi:hypothetical protein